MKKVFVIAEAGVNHNGSLELAIELVKSAKASDADAIKFQTFKTERVISKYANLAEYQKINTCESNQYDMVKKLELSYEDFVVIKEYCDKIGIQFLSTPDEKESLDFLVDKLGLDIIKIGSGEVTNLPYLKQIGAKKKKTLLSTGMSNLEEVDFAIKTLEKNGSEEIVLLHCTTDYPAKIEDVNLKAMLTLKNTFNKQVGYSDHTLGDEISIAAVAMGATIIEKHFTLDNNMAGPDHIASMNPDAFKKMVQRIRNIENALGDGIKESTEAERKNIKLVRRSIVAATNIKKGEPFTERNICCKRPGDGISPLEWDSIIGKKADRDFEEDEMIEI